MSNATSAEVGPRDAAKSAARRRSPHQAHRKAERAKLSPELQAELRNATAEPLLPIEKTLIAWSLGIGLTLLAVLAAVNHLFPPTP